ncbi:hypothetical protein QBC40DRAFT_254347 [Triangularia verruculosa]|uniref:Uncharacterized protein n=1 Tax=Triangularia verruculosa TaxID=2587418 RepID=A0AAN6XGL4_9PEZI|nr:hypothetical protein QBC40DRAFT_254347 [Triangularia verruculosa]
MGWSDDTKLEHFKPELWKDPRLKDRYPIVTHFRFPWGTTKGYYKWDVRAEADNGLVLHMLGGAHGRAAEPLGSGASICARRHAGARPCLRLREKS